VVIPGMINLDFADVCTVMKGMGRAIFGIGNYSEFVYLDMKVRQKDVEELNRQFTLHCIILY
jgi:cell division GTPase FtsZ